MNEWGVISVPDPVKDTAELADALRNYFTTRADDLGIVDVFYGDQAMVPNTPTLCVDPSVTEHEITATGMQQANQFNINVILYGAGLGDVEDIQYELDQLSDRVKNDLNVLGTFDGRIIYGFVTRQEYGYLIKSNRLMRANRLVWTATTKTRL